jgi:hypothetical protein
MLRQLPSPAAHTACYGTEREGADPRAAGLPTGGVCIPSQPCRAALWRAAFPFTTMRGCPVEGCVSLHNHAGLPRGGVCIPSQPCGAAPWRAAFPFTTMRGCPLEGCVPLHNHAGLPLGGLRSPSQPCGAAPWRAAFPFTTMRGCPVEGCVPLHNHAGLPRGGLPRLLRHPPEKLHTGARLLWKSPAWMRSWGKAARALAGQPWQGSP